MKFAIIKSTEDAFIPFKLYSYQVKVLWELLRHNLVIILKNRQVGCTWLIAGYALWKAIFRKSANVIIVSKSEESAGEVLDYCRFIYNGLPEWMKPPLDRNRVSLLAFPTLGSKIRALSSKESSGIGFGSASLVILDEHEFHPYDEENYVEIKPMIDAGGNRQLIILSAPNRMKLHSNFKNLWREAKAGRNNFFPILVPFGAVPYHTEEWYAKQTREYTKRDLETRYFKTEEEALSVTTAGKFFDADKLIAMASRILNPIPYQGIDTRNGTINIFKPPVGSYRYVVFTDPSEGKEDPFHTVVVEVATKEEVACAHGWLPADEVALIHDTLCRHYNNASNSYMRTGYSGARFQTALDNLHTQNQINSRSPDGKVKEDQYGYWESQILKKQLLGNLREGIFSLEYIIHDGKTIDEFALLIWESTSEMPAVPDKEHDDRITAWSGVVDLIRRVPRGTFRAITIRR